MGFKCGIVGLPNVGKSTLFNALTAAGAQAENYPFCTIEPNVGVAEVPDSRMTALVEIAQPAKVVPAAIQLVDIAGLVKGASQGEGLGNQFLGHIREVDAVINVVRCFEHSDVIHVHGDVNPERDIEIITTELVLKDLESVTTQKKGFEKKKKSGDAEAKQLFDLASLLEAHLDQGLPARSCELSDDDRQLAKQFQLLTIKPEMFVCNVSEDEATTGNDYVDRVKVLAEQRQAEICVVSAAIESELVSLPEEDRQEFLDSLGLKETGLNTIVRVGYRLLGLQTYFTAGPKEVRAWTVKQGASAPQAAGVIHTDFERGFIRAEVITYDDFVAHQGEKACREAGLLRTEGKDYVVQDGDVMHFLFNV